MRRLRPLAGKSLVLLFFSMLIPSRAPSADTGGVRVNREVHRVPAAGITLRSDNPDGVIAGEEMTLMKGGDLVDARPLLRFDLGTMQGMVARAQLELTIRSAAAVEDGTVVQIHAVHPLNRHWSPGVSTWNQMNPHTFTPWSGGAGLGGEGEGYVAKPMGSFVYRARDAFPQRLKVTLDPRRVSAWLADSEANAGMLLVAPALDHHGYLNFASFPAEMDQRPSLLLEGAIRLREGPVPAPEIRTQVSPAPRRIELERMGPADWAQWGREDDRKDEPLHRRAVDVPRILEFAPPPNTRTLAKGPVEFVLPAVADAEAPPPSPAGLQMDAADGLEAVLRVRVHANEPTAVYLVVGVAGEGPLRLAAHTLEGGAFSEETLVQPGEGPRLLVWVLTPRSDDVLRILLRKERGSVYLGAAGVRVK